MASEILNVWRQLIKIEKQKTGQWGGRQFPVTLYQIDKVVQHYDTAARQRDLAVERGDKAVKLLGENLKLTNTLPKHEHKRRVIKATQQFLDEPKEGKDEKAN